MSYSWKKSNSISAIGAIKCAHYIDDLLPHAPLVPCSYWGYGQEFHCNTKQFIKKISWHIFYIICTMSYSWKKSWLQKFFNDYIDSSNLSNIGVLNINSREVTFHWIRPDNAICSASHYELTAVNCGSCPNVTSRVDTQVTCTDISTDGRLCMFSVQAIGTFNGSQTVSITALLKG
jgi:hypothetical protein